MRYTNFLAGVAALAVTMGVAVAEDGAAEDGAAQAAAAKRLGQAFTRADANGDGALTLAELREFRTRTAERLDRNGDGFISSADAPRRRAARGRFDGRMDEIRTQFDANGDGRVSVAEFVDGPTAGFDRADAN
ncbi:MAG: EF-hand domain-containing protein [Pseudomonadota bacterium]